VLLACSAQTLQGGSNERDAGQDQLVMAADAGASGEAGPSCASTADCAVGTACSGGTCRPFASEDCNTALPAQEQAGANANRIVVGYVGPSAQSDDFRGIALALNELFNSLPGGGLPGGANGARRPIVMVTCSDQTDPSRAARHLADDLAVPAIIVASDATKSLALASSVAVPRGVFTLLTHARSSEISALADNGLVWQMDPGTDPSTWDQSLVSAFVTRFTAQAGSAPSSVASAALAYEGVYVLAYALVGAGSSPVTGKSLSGAMPNLERGQQIRLGTEDLALGVESLVSNGSIDVSGISGALNWNSSTGDP
jgi:hypothetical protein